MGNPKLSKDTKYVWLNLEVLKTSLGFETSYTVKLHKSILLVRIKWGADESKENSALLLSSTEQTEKLELANEHCEAFIVKARYLHQELVETKTGKHMKNTWKT